MGYDIFDDYDLGDKNQFGSVPTRFGNRTQQTAGSFVTSYTIATNKNQIASITSGGTTQSASYDLAGNMTVMPSNLLTATATYNKANKMASMVTGNEGFSCAIAGWSSTVPRTM